MRIPQSIHANSADEIQVALAFRVPQIYAATARKQHLLAVVGWQQELLLGLNDSI